MTLLVGWGSVEPRQGLYTWDPSNPNTDYLDQFLAAAIASGKKVDLAIRAGQDTPCWLFQAPACGDSYQGMHAGATSLTFSVSAVQGAGGQTCKQVPIAAPWDLHFQIEWGAMLYAVAQHLRTTRFPGQHGEMVTAYDAVVAVRVTGINRTTAEFRLPAEILPSPCIDNNGNPHTNTNAIETWLTAAPLYRPFRLLFGWDIVTTLFKLNFPDKTFTLPIIPDASGSSVTPDYPFPMIDNYGCPYAPPRPTDPTDPNYFPTPCVNTQSFPEAFPPDPDQNASLIELASLKFWDRLVVAYQNIDSRFPANPYIIYSAQNFGTMLAYQTNDYVNFQRATCLGGTASANPCASWQDYLALLEIGIYPCRTNTSLCGADENLKATYIEVLPPDALAFPEAILRAHSELQ